MRRIFLTLLILAIASLPLAAFAAEEKTAYVKSLVAKIYVEPSFGADLVGTAKRGQPLTVIGSNARWEMVIIDKKEGWVSGLLLSDNPPLGSASVFDKKGYDLSRGARRRASAVATSGASRGLISEERQRLGELGTQSDWVALRKVEESKTDISQAMNFLAGLED